VYWQREYLRQSATLPNGGTWREDLPKSGLLGGILLHIRRGGVTDSMIATEKWRLLDFVSAIEIIGNGSTVIKNVTGQLAKYLTWLDGGGGTPDKAFNYGSSTKRFHCMLNFGRFLFDHELGLDLSKWSNVEIRITNDGSATYFGGDWSVDALCYYLRDAPAGAFAGYFRTEEWRKWTTVADEKKYLELPTESKIRRIVLQTIPDVGTNNEAETTPYNVAYGIELYLKTGLLKVWDSGLRDLWYENYFDMGRDCFVALEPYTTQDKGIHTGLGQTIGAAGLRLPHDGVQDTATTSLTPGDDSSTLRRMTDTDADQDSILAMGLSLENCAVFRFDHLDDPEHYLDPLAQKTVILNVHTRNASSAADGTIRVILDRFVTR